MMLRHINILKFTLFKIKQDQQH